MLALAAEVRRLKGELHALRERGISTTISEIYIVQGESGMEPETGTWLVAAYLDETSAMEHAVLAEQAAHATLRKAQADEDWDRLYSMTSGTETVRTVYDLEPRWDDGAAAISAEFPARNHSRFLANPETASVLAIARAIAHTLSVRTHGAADSPGDGARRETMTAINQHLGSLAHDLAIDDARAAITDYRADHDGVTDAQAARALLDEGLSDWAAGPVDPATYRALVEYELRGIAQQ